MDLSKAIKHLVDRLGALLVLPLMTPVLLLLCMLIRLQSRGNPLLLQERIGAHGRAFTMFCFRTQRLRTPTAEAAQEPTPETATTSHRDAAAFRNEPAPASWTGMGRVVRALRLEPLPQLINVLLGEMSFVGPVPVQRGEIDSYTPRQSRRLMFRPGMTGWAQIHAHDALATADRIAHDLTYCERFSLWWDVRILWHAWWGTQPRKRNETAARGPVANSTRELAAGTAQAKAMTSNAGTASGTPRTGVVPRAQERGSSNTGAAASDAQRVLVPTIVIGMGGHARVVLDAIEKQGVYRVLGLVADAKSRGTATEAFGYPILGGVEKLQQPQMPRRAVVALGSGRARESWFGQLEQRDFDIVPVVHPHAHVGRDVVVGAGTVVLAGAVVNSGVVLGRGVLVRAGSTLDHDCHLEDFAHVAPGAHLAGDVRVGARSHVGIGACVVPGIHIGADVLVGAGAVVTQSVPPGHTVIGTPGRTMRRPDLPGRAAASTSAGDAAVSQARPARRV